MTEAELFKDPTCPPIVYYVPAEKFIYRTGNRWAMDNPVGNQGAIAFLLTQGLSHKEAKVIVSTLSMPRAFAADYFHRQPPFFFDAGDNLWKLNTGHPSNLVPKPGPYPRLERTLLWICDSDTSALHWLKHWMAAKVQQPALSNKVAVLMTGLPGSGKNTVYAVLREMLGRDNCAVIQRGDLESSFNARWVTKLLVLGDEIVGKEGFKDIGEQLKVLINGDEIQRHAKYANQLTVKNRISWLFASNSDVALDVEDGDRRYTILSNHDELPEDYRTMLAACWNPDDTPTSSFREEIAGLYAELLDLKVDRTLVRRPYENEARRFLIEANRPAHETFFRQVDEHGIDEWLERVTLYSDYSLNAKRETWDFKEKGIARSVVYRCYVEFCKSVGQKPRSATKFGVAVKNHRPVWGTSRVRSANHHALVRCYMVPRNSLKQPETCSN